jgi:hypothetical protein
LEGLSAADEELSQLREQVAAQGSELEQLAAQRLDLETALVRPWDEWWVLIVCAHVHPSVRIRCVKAKLGKELPMHSMMMHNVILLSKTHIDHKPALAINE